MQNNWINNFGVLIILCMSHLLALTSIIVVKKQKLIFILTLILGTINIICLRLQFDHKKITKFTILLKLDKIIFIWEIYVSAIVTFNLKLKYNYGVFLILYGVCDTIRNIITYIFYYLYFSKTEYKNFKDVIKLERIILKSKFGYKNYSDEFIINYIKANPQKYDPRLLFCLWTNDELTRKLYPTEEALSLIKQRIKEKNEHNPIDIDELSEKKETIKNEVDLPNKLSDKLIEQNIELITNKLSTDIGFNEGEDYNLIFEDYLKEKDSYSDENFDNENTFKDKKEFNNHICNDFDSDSELNINQPFKSIDTEKNNFTDDVNYLFDIFNDSEHISLSKKKTNNNQTDLSVTIQCNNKEEEEKIKQVCEEFDYSQNELDHTIKINDYDYEIIIKNQENELNGIINKESLKQYLTDNDASEGINLLTRGFDHQLNFIDFYDNMRQYNNERDGFLKMLNANLIIKNILNLIFVTIEIVCLLIIFMFLFLYTGQMKSLIMPILLFILPGIWYFYTPFLYLIYHKPFEIGDRVIIKNDILIVKEIQLCYTLFERWNNDYVIINNEYISKEYIANIKKSNSQIYTFSFYITNKTQENTINLLKNHLIAFTKQSNCLKSVQIICNGIYDSNYYLLTINIKHAKNHHNAFFMWKTQNIFMTEFINQCNQLKISYYPMKITYSNFIDNEIDKFGKFIKTPFCK